MRWTTAGVLLAIFSTTAVVGAAGKIPATCSTAADVKDAAANVRYCITNRAAAGGMCGRNHLDVQTFNNNGLLLPKAAPSQVYVEGKVRSAEADAGTRRLVMLVLEQRSGKKAVLKQYYSGDHYKTFCQIGSR